MDPPRLWSSDERKSILTYVALRDVAPQSQRLGDGKLTWSASYITPRREWRHIAELHSYIYASGDSGARDRAAVQAENDKRWLDKAGLSFQGGKIVGVIRPPRTIKADGSAAFGPAAGIVQENGQVRFTFSETDARALAAFMIAQRPLTREAARVIAPGRYIFQAVGGSRTASGVCTGDKTGAVPGRPASGST